MSSPAQDQIAFVHKLTSDPQLRQTFLSDPVKAAASQNVVLDDDLKVGIVHSIGQIDKRAVDLAHKNPFGQIGGGQGPAMNVVLEAAAVVAAGAAVVSAVTAVYNATKFTDVGNFDKAKLISGSPVLTNQIGRIGAEVSANSHIGAQIGQGGLFHP